MKFYGTVRHNPVTNPLYFVGIRDQGLDPGIY